MVSIRDLQIQIFADGADLDGIRTLRANPLIRGFTTNPTLMRQAGIKDYLEFSRQVLDVIDGLPISLEVFSDDFSEMKRQALKLSALASNVNVKIPITNSKGESSVDLVRELVSEGVSLNVTAIFTLEQIGDMVDALDGSLKSYVSVFAGRIADAGVDPLPIMKEALARMRVQKQLELIWASPREILNVVQANQIGCHVITVTHDLLKKLSSLGKDLNQFSLETVTMFATDARNAGFTL